MRIIKILLYLLPLILFSCDSGEENLPDFGGNQIELEFDIKADSNSSIAIQVLKHEDGQEYTTLTFDYEINKIVLDRRQSTLSLTKKDTRIGDFIFNPQDTLNIRIFIDHSTLEVFVQNLTVFSSRVYPSRAESDKVDIVAVDGNVEVIKASQWQMASMLDHQVQDVSCTPANLPTAFNQMPQEEKEIVTGTDNSLGAGVYIYPNPSSTHFNIDSTQHGIYSLMNISGKVVTEGEIKSGRSRIELNDIPGGIYIMNIDTSVSSYSKKLIVTK